MPAPRALLMAAALVLAGPAAAEPRIPPSVLPGLGDGDPRQLVDPAALPWSALGRVQTELGGRCTGTLIGPNAVLTAAHCLVAQRTGRLVRPSSVHFLLGYRQGTWRATARVAEFRTGPAFDPKSSRPSPSDWAVLLLEQPVGTAEETLPLLGGYPAQGLPLMLGGYQQDRPEVLMADTACQVLGMTRQEDRPLIVHNCTATRGASGAPLLMRRSGGGWGVAGISMAAARGASLGLAVPTQALQE